MSPSQRILWIAIIVAFIGVASSASRATAQGKTKGISVQIEDQWIQSNFGYKRIKVTIALTPRQPAPETLNFNVVIKQMDGYGGQEHAVVTRPITLEQGTTSVELEIYVPQTSNMFYGGQSTIHVESDGNLTYDRGRDLAIKYNSMNYYGGQTSMPTLLIVSSSVKSNLVSKFVKTKKGSTEIPGDTLMIDELKFPSIQVLCDFYQDNQNQIGAVKNNPTASDLLQSLSIHAVSPSDVPRSWLGLTSTEIILISHNDLVTVSQDVQQLQAIRKWIAAGGSLIVFDCGAGLKKASNVRELVDGRKLISAERKSPWLIPGEKLKKETSFLIHAGRNQAVYIGAIQTPNTDFSNKSDARSARQDWTTVEPGADLSAKLEESGFPFAMYQYILGRVTVVNDDMQNWTVDQWRILLNANLIEGRTIRERMGAGSAAIPEATMAISDVGQPPVNAFKVLIGLFVLAVGPISYFVLKKQRRLQLLFAIVPAISLLACLGLMLFAILSDGFQNRGRMRTFTAIDHAKQQAVSFSRHSHYQGVQPRDYRFGSEEAIFNSKAGTSPRSIYRQTNNDFSINGGDIRPRMPHQFVSVNSFETEQALILIDGTNETAPQIRNQFETAVRCAVFSTTAGVFFVENVAPGETATGTLGVEQSKGKKPWIDNKTLGLVRKLRAEISPDVKDEFLKLSAYSGNPYYFYGYGNNNSETANFEADFQFSQLADTVINELPNQPGNYIAILEEYTDITLPADNIDYKNKIHIIHGKW